LVSVRGNTSVTDAPVTVVVPLLLTTMTYVTGLFGETDVTPSLLVIARSVCGSGAGVIKSASIATLLAGAVSTTPAGAVTVATLATAPVAAGLSVAVTV
jgi:hypothetical protein